MPLRAWPLEEGGARDLLAGAVLFAGMGVLGGLVSVEADAPGERRGRVRAARRLAVSVWVALAASLAVAPEIIARYEVGQEPADEVPSDDAEQQNQPKKQ